MPLPPSIHQSANVQELKFCLHCRDTCHKTALYDVDVREDQLPIIYSPEYNITFGGLQKLHPFDSEKWGRIAQYLQG